MDENTLSRLNAEITRTYYAYTRYKTISTFALLHCEKEIHFQTLGSFIRATDRFIQINPNEYFIIFHYTSLDNTYKACKNLLYNLDTYFNSTTSCIAIDEFDLNKNSNAIIQRLKQIINQTKKHSLSRIEYDDILDDII